MDNNGGRVSEVVTLSRSSSSSSSSSSQEKHTLPPAFKISRPSHCKYIVYSFRRSRFLKFVCRKATVDIFFFFKLAKNVKIENRERVERSIDSIIS